MDKARRIIEYVTEPDEVNVDEELAAFLSEVLGIDVETVKKRLSNSNVYSLESFVDGVNGKRSL
jgi:hypothetical protein